MQQDSQLIAYHELIQWRPMAAKTQVHSYKYNMQKLPGDRFTSRNIEIQLKTPTKYFTDENHCFSHE
jgi:hypothetical protein